VTGLASSFTVVEAHKGRRRWILHPPEFNQLHSDKNTGTPTLPLGQTWDVPFPSFQQLEGRVLSRHAICLDFKAFYQQFGISLAAGKSFAFKDSDGAWWAPTTIPTGATSAPKMCQLILLAFGQAIRTQFPDVSFDGLIDNVRLSGDKLENLLGATSLLLALARQVNCTWNPEFVRSFSSSGEACTNKYTFLGIVFDHSASSVQLSSKTLQKLAKVRTELSRVFSGAQSDSPQSTWSLRDLLRVMGILHYSSIITKADLSLFYNCYKYARTMTQGADGSSFQLDDPIPFWPSCQPSFCRWLRFLIRNTPRVVKNSLTPPHLTMFTDASLSGWGAILFGGRHVLVVAGRWAPSSVIYARATAGINFLELRAVRLALKEFLPTLLLHEVRFLPLRIDNTSALYAIRKSRSGSYALNCEVSKIGRLLRAGNISLLPTYIKSGDNPADYWSRLFERGLDSANSPLQRPTVT
jgi:hypothetical protein